MQTATAITYGTEAGENEFPFVVYTNGTLGCTGVLVDREWVVTSAYCLGYDTTVVLGDYSRSTIDDSEQVITIADEVPHPMNAETILFDNDIGLIKLARRANIRSDAVATINPVNSKSFMKKVLNNKKNCVTLGWGLTNTPDGLLVPTDKLQKLEMRFVNITEYDIFPYVQGAVGVEAITTDRCGRGSVCIGDSGAPVVCKQRGKWVLVGIGSFMSTLDACNFGVKGMMNVQLYNDWIESVISQ